ncbi:MAG: TusE/DsrC/DsvC family sulfur relay protein [Thiotrichaceae bacterium]|nr:TusE/DsrC/DsvC family sulfur relay protein [Thiotrichaceae bacterium]
MSTSNPMEISVDRCPDGFLKNPEDWNEHIARKLAAEWKGLEFTQQHLDLILFMRSFHAEHHITPDVREATHFLTANGMDKKAAKKQLFTLFPHGYMQQGCKIAGMRRPTSWCVG